MEHASTVDIGARKRRRDGINEDGLATAVLENHHRQTGRSVGVFVLGDGVGGEASGDVASFLATTIVRQRLVETLSGPGTDVLERFDIDAAGTEVPTVGGEDPEAVLSEERIREAIQEAVDEAHQEIQAYARELGARPATTLVVAVYADGVLHYGWVGDSRLYVIDTEHDEITQLTRDHAVTNEMLERGEIEHEEYARVHEDATAITNAVGGSGHGKPTVDVEFGRAEIYSGDVIALTSDGIIDAYPDVGPLRQRYQQADDVEPVLEEIRDTLVTDDEIREIVTSAPDLHAAAEELIEFANERGGKDNLSVTLARDPDAEPTPEEPPERSVEPARRGRTAVGPADEEDAAEAESADAEPDEDDAEAEPSSDSGPEPDAADADDPDRGDVTVADLPESVDVVSVGDVEPSAALAIPSEDLIVEIGDTVTVGNAHGDGDRPDIALDVDDVAAVDRINTAVEPAEDDGWVIRDTSSSGTYVEVREGEWLLLLSSEGAELHRQHGFDPGEATDQDILEETALEDGVAFTLEDPRSDGAVPCEFYSSLASATARFAGEDADGDTEFKRFLT